MADDLKILVASHKAYWMPKDFCYMPVQVGSAGKQSIPGFQRDDEGENISAKNPNYCELTGLYWAWKNLQSDWLGLAHYRRHFSAFASTDPKRRVASGEFLLHMLDRCPVILPTERNYFVETNRTQYVHAHNAQDLDTVRTVIAERSPYVLSSYDESMRRTHGHRFNMFVMRRDLADAWCDWLFGVLFELEARLDISGYSPNDARVFGFVSERLLDPWIQANGIPYVSLPVANLESQHWPKKAASFLGRKLKASS